MILKINQKLLKVSRKNEFWFPIFHHDFESLDESGEEENVEQTITDDPTEQPLEINDKPFNIKKFRANLRKSECVMGKWYDK